MDDLSTGSPGLTLDLYHIDAAYVAWKSGQTGTATFDLYTRSHPFAGAYLLVAGLEAALAFVHDFRFTADALAYLTTIRPYDPAFLTMLERLRFTGQILAMPEGTVAFAPEPLLRVTAPFAEALLLESGLLHAIGRATLIATKAARIVRAAQNRAVTEFALRRAPEPMVVARSAAIGGCVATSYVDAARTHGLPSAGTIPHALIQAFPSEGDAFRAVAASLNRFTLLLDTYDVNRSIATAVEVGREAPAHWGHHLTAVRLDSGDLVADSHIVRQALDHGGLSAVKILASGDLDEYRIADLIEADAPIDGFGVGTSVGIGAGSRDHGVPGGSLGVIYKLVWYDDPAVTGDGPRIKIAGAKSTWPGQKQVYRVGDYERDIIQLDDEPPPPNGVPLLQPVVLNGAIAPDGHPLLADIRERAAASLAALPEPYHRLVDPSPYPVERSPGLEAMRRDATALPWQGK